MNPQFNQTASGTLTGTALALLMQVTNTELLKTVVMAAIGAAVSFLVSYTIKTILKWIRK
jgi:mannitol-specific phosphotransferase system IIBC component